VVATILGRRTAEAMANEAEAFTVAPTPIAVAGTKDSDDDADTEDHEKVKTEEASPPKITAVKSGSVKGKK